MSSNTRVPLNARGGIEGLTPMTTNESTAPAKNREDHTREGDTLSFFNFNTPERAIKDSSGIKYLLPLTTRL